MGSNEGSKGAHKPTCNSRTASSAESMATPAPRATRISAPSLRAWVGPAESMGFEGRGPPEYIDVDIDIDMGIQLDTDTDK